MNAEEEEEEQEEQEGEASRAFHPSRARFWALARVLWFKSYKVSEGAVRKAPGSHRRSRRSELGPLAFHQAMLALEEARAEESAKVAAEIQGLRSEVKALEETARSTASVGELKPSAQQTTLVSELAAARRALDAVRSERSVSPARETEEGAARPTEPSVSRVRESNKTANGWAILSMSVMMAVAGALALTSSVSALARVMSMATVTVGLVATGMVLWTLLRGRSGS